MYQIENKEEVIVKIYVINHEKENDGQTMADGLQLYNHTWIQNDLSENRVEIVKLIFSILLLLALFFSFIVLLIIKFCN
ncbi:MULTISPECIES: hypothetical protein [Flavobacterium]|uniref:hypothetical protein n=1 Tax=Flavobacterium TaxID=237 RepID=UPI00034C007C|nr:MULTISPECIES: hypothetical protein [Flavobacterium]MDL2144952.1 hypothetical protein [Flavobacterium tructae]